MRFAPPATLASIVLTCCASGGRPVAPADPASTSTPRLRCTLQALGNSGVGGTLEVAQVDGGVLVTGQVTGLAPDSTHGFHIHEKGDCSAPDGTSAGGHFNPAGVSHGGLDATLSHAGDLGNVVANALGVATVKALKHGAELTEGNHAVLGRGIIVHANADDLTSQPTGAAGGRIACGVIVMAP